MSLNVHMCVVSCLHLLVCLCGSRARYLSLSMTAGLNKILCPRPVLFLGLLVAPYNFVVCGLMWYFAIYSGFEPLARLRQLLKFVDL